MNGSATRALAWAVATVALVAVPASAVAVVLPDPGHAVDDTLSVTQGGDAGLDVTANDVVNGGFQLSTVGEPAHGHLEGRMGSPGWYQYFPDAGFAGADSFRYQLVFDGGTVSVGTVRITVVALPRTTTTTRTTRTTTTTTTRPRATTTTTSRRTTTTTTRARRSTTRTTRTSRTTTTTGGRRPPVATDDGAAADLGTTVVVDVLANDHAGPGARLVPTSVAILGIPLHGDAVVRADGSIAYTAGTETSALSERLRYRVSDDAGASAEATLQIALREPDDLLHGRNSSAPGSPVDVAGSGCTGSEPVAIEVDGSIAARVTTLSDGGFTTALQAPSGLGRYRIRAVCSGHAMQSWLDVVQTTSADGGGRAPVATGMLATVGAVLTFYLLSGFLLAPAARRRDER